VRLVMLACVIACNPVADERPRKQPKPAPKAPVEPRIAAIGDVDKLPVPVRRALDPAAFTPMGTPRDGDWIAEHSEDKQPFSAYIKSNPNAPYPGRNTIYLLPLGDFPPTAPSIESLSQIVHAYYTLEVKVLPAVPLQDVVAKRRVNAGSKKTQLLAPDVLKWLEEKLPKDAFALMAVTMEDLYPEPTWNFVFGMASFEERVGVQSFARQDPAFFDEKRTPGWEKLALRRATWTVIHEIGHMFGIHHCQYFECVMAGSNSQDEADRRPLHACPVDLHKLYWALMQYGEVDLLARERELARTLKSLGIDDEAAWSERQARRIGGG
jgi:archaemetzincin